MPGCGGEEAKVCEDEGMCGPDAGGCHDAAGGGGIGALDHELATGELGFRLGSGGGARHAGG